MANVECTQMSLRLEMVSLASRDGANKAEIFRRFGCSRKTGYKWLKQFREFGAAGLLDRSRKPRSSPNRTKDKVEQAVLAVRLDSPAWGGRKIAAVLKREGLLPAALVPPPSTITSILRRHGMIDPEESAKRQAIIRFERELPNELWQMDFKGDFLTTSGCRCYPLTLLDDHSRYSLLIEACSGQTRLIVQAALTRLFTRYGLPRAMLMDNGTPWSVSHQIGGHTKLSVWLMRLDIEIIRGRPGHPQTQGKEERFHGTLKRELLAGRDIDDLIHAQCLFDPWRNKYNHKRPHEALAMAVPADRYQPSKRRMPAELPQIEYGPEVQFRTSNPVGQFSFHGYKCKLSEAFSQERIGLRPTATDGLWQTLFGRFEIGWLDLRHADKRRTTVVRTKKLD